MDTPRASSSCPSRGDTAKKLLPVALILWTVGQAMAGGHDQARCNRCHGDGAAAGAVSLDREACTGCHVKAARGDGQPQALFHGDQSQSCVRCHRYHDADTVITPGGSLSLAALAGVDREHCRTCHQPQARRDRLSPGHEAAAALYHERAADLAGLSPSAACRACHSQGAGVEAWRHAVEGRAIAFADHTSHPCEIAVHPGQATVGSRIRPDIDPRLNLPAGQLECVTCHDLTADTPSSLVAFAAPSDLCLGCHQLKQPEPTTIVAIDLMSPKIPN
jgi:predicted CXXCH cytochrome family protein